MTSSWRKQLYKGADVLINIPPGQQFWPEDMFEPLTFALFCPLLPRSPWKAKYWEGMFDWNKDLSNMWESDPGTVRDHMCKLWDQTGNQNKRM